jgi:hypothetical protein
MSNRPVDHISISVKIALATLVGSKDEGNVPCDRGFSARTAMVLDSTAFISRFSLRVPERNIRKKWSQLAANA